MKLKYIFMIYFLYAVSASFVFAEYYHYVDKDGIKHYTDDISEVPIDQRPNLSIYQSIQAQDKEELPKTEQATDTITPESIATLKSELDNEYAALVKKREAMVEQKKDLSEKEYNVLSAQLNIEIKQYQDKADAYEMLVKDYNEQIKASPEN